MPITLRLLKRPVACGLAAIALAGSALDAQTISFSDFSSTAGLKLNGSAAQSGNLLRLTPALLNQGGSAFSTTPVTLNADASFSTFFTFQILGRGGLGGGADGLTFTVQPNANNVGGIGGGIGYAGIPNSMAVEFDTFDNGEPGGSNHVGIDLNGTVIPHAATTGLLTPDFDNGSVWYAWVDYDGTADALAVRWAQSAVRPVGSMLSLTVDLPAILGTTNTFVGFTSGTGAGFGEHDILSWNFVNRFLPDGAPPPETTTPEPATLALVAGGLAVLGASAKRRRRAD